MIRSAAPTSAIRDLARRTSISDAEAAAASGLNGNDTSERSVVFAPQAPLCDSWPDPTPLPDHLTPVAAFDVDALLPGNLRPWVQDIAERMQCPVEYPAVAALVALSSLVGARVVMLPKQFDNWEVVPNLWGVCIGRPGQMKSPPMREVLRILERFEAQAADQHKNEHDEWERERKLFDMVDDARQKRAQKILDKAGGTLASARAELEGDGSDVPLPEEPQQRRYIVNDATVEKLGVILKANPFGLLVYRDELYGLLASLDKSGQEGSRSFYVTAADGNQGHTVDRIGRGSIPTKRICLSMLGSIQPGKIERYVRDALEGGSGDDGLLQRFGLMVWPDQKQEFVNVDRRPDADAAEVAAGIFQRLSALEPDGKDGRPAQWYFHPDAQSVFTQWRIALEQELRSGELHVALESHLSKYRKLVPALALLFALIDTPHSNGIVQLAELSRAIALAAVLRTHAERLYNLAAVPEVSAAAMLLRRIQQGRLEDGFTCSKVAQKGWSGMKTPDVVRKAAEVLMQFDWLRRGTTQPSSAGGRPGEFYLINPAVRLQVEQAKAEVL